MNLFTIAWKSIRQRALSSLLTSLSVALGVMLEKGEGGPRSAAGAASWFRKASDLGHPGATQKLR